MEAATPESLQAARGLTRALGVTHTVRAVEVKPAAEILDPEVRTLAARAQSYVEHFGWCQEVRACHLGFAISGVLGVFRVELEPRGAGVDPAVWVVVGDLPPAYLVFEEGDGWQDGLRSYVDEMRRWVATVRAGESTLDVIPVNAPATSLNADLLASRLDFLQHRLLDVDPGSLESDS
jgi:hypothetical protein